MIESIEALVYTFLLVATLGIIFFNYIFSRTSEGSNSK